MICAVGVHRTETGPEGVFSIRSRVKVKSALQPSLEALQLASATRVSAPVPGAVVMARSSVFEPLPPAPPSRVASTIGWSGVPPPAPSAKPTQLAVSWIVREIPASSCDEVTWSFTGTGPEVSVNTADRSGSVPVNALSGAASSSEAMEATEARPVTTRARNALGWGHAFTGDNVSPTTRECMATFSGAPVTTN